MSDQERFERANRAKSAWDEFVSPYIETVRGEYLGKLSQVAANVGGDKDIKAIVLLSAALQTIDRVEAQFRAAMVNGEDVARQTARAEQIAQIPARKRRWADMLGA